MSVRQKWQGTKPLKFTTDEAIQLILPILKSDPRIWAAYLFGSRRKRELQTPVESDIDIAIYTSDDFLWEDYYLLNGESTKRLHSDRLDIVWMNKAEPILSFEIIKNSKVLFFYDADTLNEFELKIKKRYYDYIMYLNRHRRQREIGL
ncbi:MAG: nucleotidyltransferase domain-containing protein [Nitrospira sp.]|nr:nucleotidyltransferase domain-containing protein [Nitrospira sp.]